MGTWELQNTEKAKEITRTSQVAVACVVFGHLVEKAQNARLQAKVDLDSSILYTSYSNLLPSTSVPRVTFSSDALLDQELFSRRRRSSLYLSNLSYFAAKSDIVVECFSLFDSMVPLI